MNKNGTKANAGESPDLWEEIHSLATRCELDHLSDTDIARLETLLRTSQEARRIYVGHVFETTALVSLLQPAADLEEVTAEYDTASEVIQTADAAKLTEEKQARIEDPMASSEGQMGRPTVLGLLVDSLQFLRGNAAWSSGLAAVLTIAALGAFGLLRFPGSDTSDMAMAPGTATAIQGMPSGRPQVATLTGVVDCQWAADLRAPDYGEPILEGRIIDLKEGLAQLTFESGAKMILQGPASFTADSEMGGTLDRGKLSTLVPERATGFMVRTPSAEIIDLGTEFGVQVDQESGTEVHVLQGEVVSWGLDVRGKAEGDGVHVTEDRSLTYAIGGSDTVEGKADATRFVRQITARLSNDELPALPVRHDLVLWLAADLLVSTDTENRVIAWQDILFGDNQSKESAWQHEIASRPVLVENAIGGKPAIRFDGTHSFLVTTPMATTDDQTIFILFQRSAEPKRPRQYRQLINYNGPPFRVPEYGFGPGILQIGDGTEPKAKLPQPGAYRAMVHAGVTAEQVINTGFVRSRRIEVGEPTVLSYLYDRSSNRAEMLLNGESQGVSSASTSIAMNSRKALGRHPQQPSYFEGDMAEVLIYNRGLESTEIDLVTRYLMDKYGVRNDNTKLENTK